MILLNGILSCGKDNLFLLAALSLGGNMKKIDFVLAFRDDYRSQLWDKEVIQDAKIEKRYSIYNKDDLNRECPSDIELIASGYLAIALEIHFPLYEAVPYLTPEGKWLIGFPVYNESEESEFPYSKVWRIMFEKTIQIAEEISKDSIRVCINVSHIKAKQSREVDQEMLDAFNDNYREYFLDKFK